jgi:hypothetical protein
MNTSLASSLLLAALIASPVSAQVFEDTFPYPNGPVIPGWTARTGVWTVTNQRIRTTSGSVWSYITKDGFTLKDCVMDGDFYFVGAGTQFAGLTARHQGGTTDSNLLMCKIQNNSGLPDFDRVYIYERPSPSLFADIPGGTLSARLRMIVLDAQCWLLVDANTDGVFEQTVGPMTLPTMLNAGLVGMNGFQTSEMDNFKLYDAVLIGAPGSTPKIGTTYQMQLRAAQPQGTLFVCAASFGAAGIPIDTRKIPLSVDALLLMSFSAPGLFSFVGMLDGQGNGAPSIHLPNDPSLVGLSLHVAGMTFVGTAPSGIANISNNHYITIVQ